MYHESIKKNQMKLILQSRWQGDNKWNFRAEGFPTSQTLISFERLIRKDGRLKTKNHYRIIKKD